MMISRRDRGSSPTVREGSAGIAIEPSLTVGLLPRRRPWFDGPNEWKGWWGDEPPYHTPVFVLTHYPRAPLKMKGGTTFHFVTDGIHSALTQAKDVAGEKDVRLGGGVATFRRFGSI